MDIRPVLLNFRFPYRNTQNNHSDYSHYSVPVMKNSLNSDIFVKNNPSFSAIKSAAGFRNLAENEAIHCIYCGRPMFVEKVLTRLKSRGVFSGPIKNFVQEIFPYLEYLHPSEKQFFKKVTLMTFDYPQITLTEAIKKMYPRAHNELLKEQQPILKEISDLGKNLPYGWKTKLKNLLKISRYRLTEKPYIPDEFSGKEFTYKIKRLYDTISDDVIAKRIAKLAEPLTHPVFKKTDEQPAEKFVKKILTLTDSMNTQSQNLTKSELQILLLKRIQDYANILKRRDIIMLCESGIKTIRREPVTIQFSNKSFKYDLHEVLENMPDLELTKKLFQAADRLPNSKNSVNAFITKHEKAAADTIGYNMLRPSIVTIEHMHPKSQGGANELYNFALACERDNNTRSNQDMKEFIRPFDIKKQKNYFKEIMREVKNKNIDEKTAKKMLKAFINESGRDISI